MLPNKKRKLGDGTAEEKDEGDVASGPAATEGDVAMEVAAAEPEGDAPEDGRPQLQDEVAFLAEDSTLNVMPSSFKGVLMTLTEGGLQYLVAGARANVGIKSGRYMFEARIVELMPTVDTSANQARKSPVLRIGFSLAGVLPIMGDTKDSICFDSDGYVAFNRKRTAIPERFTSDCVLAVVLNLVEGSPSCGSVSLFKDGVRVCEPQPLPEALRGRILYPTVTFRSLSVHVHCGPRPLVQLPFKCRTLQEAALDDVEVHRPMQPADGKYEVIFPICAPDEGTFDWLDWWLETHPGYTELSDRKIIDWAVRSGLVRGKINPYKNSLDRPEMNFGIPQLDDGSAKHVLHSVTAMTKRNFVVMQVQGNLVPDERAELLRGFRMPHFRRVALVMIGEPPVEFTARSHELMLARKRDLERRRRELERQAALVKKNAIKRQKKVELERKRKVEADKKAKDGSISEAAKADTGGKEDEVEEEEEEEKEESREAIAAAVEKEVELTEEEKRVYFRKNKETMDLSTFQLNTAISKFSLPREAEGFHKVDYAWQSAEKAADYLKQWILDRKLTTRVEDLQPGDFFLKRWQLWQRDLGRWQRIFKEYRDPKKRSAMTATKKASKKEEEANDFGVEKEKDEDEMDAFKALQQELLRQESDIFSVEDIEDVGNCRPLFASWEFEDWGLLNLRFEMHLMVHAFRRDSPDPERRGMHPEHLAFYYTKYYKKALNPKLFKAENAEDMLELIKDTVVISCQRRVVESYLNAELEINDIFVKLTEDARRHRQKRVDAGDVSAQLRFPNRPVEALVAAPPPTTAPARPMIPPARPQAARPQPRPLVRPQPPMRPGPLPPGQVGVRAAAAPTTAPAAAPTTAPAVRGMVATVTPQMMGGWNAMQAMAALRASFFQGGWRGW